jgi:hypothetical protein
MASGASLPKGLHPADQAPVLHLGDGEAATAATAAAPAAMPAGLEGLDAGDVAVVAEYLRLVQGMLATGQEIIRAHTADGARR